MPTTKVVTALIERANPAATTYAILAKWTYKPATLPAEATLRCNQPHLIIKIGFLFIFSLRVV
jgi:hypothetical protein